ncbi:3-deoxy-7-phosphoheptulonate synthase [Carboxylicivirga sp. A043]|uniref:3-deoxy-7-phosphoheptulonate synthase n=1 Tax=Carboxylicivirga litoralis TaxID=2816963 RepID=UPI0021CB2C16|nr:3-deoxy-7-phosphoheptulonate synthase [Carboxylicivirga sp. A043]MCU4156650.1 3-deoxy-7-phosphoheptulonate synthase [Carboxylicivirga sp. A043]
MTDLRIENLNVFAEEPIITPDELKRQYPLTDDITKTILDGQNTVKRILHKKDERLLVVVGPCSIHDIKAAKEYAQKLKLLADEVSDTLYLIMRVYFEKPRTTVGWQGLINDPYLDNSCNVEDGLKMARELLLYIAELGLPAAGEALDIVTPQYIQDLFCWTAIGARTTESQSHRNMASGLSSVVGFKNGTKGSIDIAINARESVAAPHNFVSINPDGKVAVVKTKGNPNSHIILRGGKEPNYSAEQIAQYESELKIAGLEPRIMIDCSHANSGKKACNQSMVLNDIANQITSGNNSIMGVMIESNLKFGNQKLTKDTSSLKYGVSITDECIGWEETEEILRDLRNKLKA